MSAWFACNLNYPTVVKIAKFIYTEIHRAHMALEKLCLGIKIQVRETIWKVKFDSIHGTPDIIILGENHKSEYASLEQAALVRFYRPEFFLDEGFNNSEAEDNEWLLKNYEFVTLSQISQRSGITLESMGITQESFDRIKKREKELLNEITDFYINRGNDEKSAKEKACSEMKQEGLFPKNYKSLLKTPVYELHAEVISVIQDLIVGKTNSLNEGSELYRRLYALEEYLSYFRIEGFNADLRRRTDRVLHAIADVKGKLAGCDIDKEIPKIGRGPEATVKLFDDLTDYTTAKREERENEMGQKAVKYASRRMTKRPIIMKIGRMHARESSSIYSHLNAAGLKYRTIIQRSEHLQEAENLIYCLQLGIR